MQRKLSSVVYASIFILLAGGCVEFSTGGDDGQLSPQTQILDVRVAPNPVAVGDTATFTVVILDSLDTSFQFTWFLDAPPQETDENHIQWIADKEPGRYSFSVGVDNDDPMKRPVGEEFSVEVIQ